MKTFLNFTSTSAIITFLLFVFNINGQSIVNQTDSRLKNMVSTNVFKPVTVKGNRFVVDNQEVQFKGLCLQDLAPLLNKGHWNEEYIRQASLWKVNIVRFAVHPSHLNKMGKEKYIEELKKGVEWAKKYNMYSIIDWHIIGNLQEEKWQDPMYKTDLKETLDFWKTIAITFKDEPAVAFYELYNEPTVWHGKLGKMTWEQLIAIYKQINDTINTYDSAKVKLLAGFNWAYELKPLKNYTPEMKNIAFVSHPYPQKSPEPWPKNWDKNFGFAAEKYPIFCTEFGFSYKDQKGAHIPVMGDEKYGEAILDYFNKKNISYTIWCFSWEWPPYLLKDSTFTPIEGQGEFFYNKFMEMK